MVSVVHFTVAAFGGWSIGEGAGMSGRELFAHSQNPWGVRHLLVDHLRGSAALARGFGEVFGAGEAAEFLGLVHDVGKGCCAWQERLGVVEGSDGRVGVPHKEAGTVLAARVAGRQLAAVVQGHHGGLPDQVKVKEVVAELRGSSVVAEQAREATAAVARLLPEAVRAERIAPPSWLAGIGSAERRAEALDLYTRMVFSCVVDADYLDTAAHFAGGSARVAGPVDMGALWERFRVRREGVLAARGVSPVDGVRGRVFEEAVASGEGERGWHVLHVPTGGAKTMAGAGFALRHAVRHGLRRVVVAVPFISVTEQTAQVYRDLLDPEERSEEGPGVVLEHHSAVQLEGEGAEGAWGRLAAENWDAPVVVTTTVQLFQSLFSRKPSAMRKLHRLAGSVIVLDEVQALPDRLLVPILSVLRELVEHFGVSVVLASATQPAFWSLSQLEGVPRRMVVGDASNLFEELRRVGYEWRMGEGVTWESVAREIAEEGGEQVLAVVNTTRDSARLHRLLTGEEPGVVGVAVPVWHLSTRMTSGHRREVIEHVRGELKAGRPVHVVSTSLIEAGVDVDFPRVYRAWAPAESLQQAAGRCNRDGRLGEGRVVVFRPAGGGMPKDLSYRAAMDATAEFFGPDLAFPDDLEALGAYYRKRWALQGAGNRAMGEEIQEMRRRWDFPAVADAFQMIDNAYAQSVVVVRPGRPKVQDAIEADIGALRSPYPCGPEPLRRLQPHMATLPRHEVARALKAGLAEPVVGDLVVWRGFYDPVRGLDADRPEDRGGFVL
ncbi:CRISPR-associated endonuclease Cas3'' [Streptomyces albidoflavus]